MATLWFCNNCGEHSRVDRKSCHSCARGNPRRVVDLSLEGAGPDPALDYPDDEEGVFQPEEAAEPEEHAWEAGEDAGDEVAYQEARGNGAGTSINNDQQQSSPL